MDQKNKRLGRGLNALFGDDEQPTYNVAYAGNENAQTNTTDTTDVADTIKPKNVLTTNGQTILRVPITALQPSRFQPRRTFNDESLADLAASLKQHGVLQPLLVRELNEPAANGATYEIIAGERRWRAAQTVPLHELPVMVRSFTPEQALQIALIENLQREDLNPVEEAAGYQRLLDEYQYTQDDLAGIIGKSRSHISNMLRVMTLDDGVKAMLADGQITAGHARALVKAKDPKALADLVVRKNLSVRETEKLAQQEAVKYRGAVPKSNIKNNVTAIANAVAPSATPGQKTADILALEKSISDMLGLMVEIETSKGTAGKITISYRDLDQLDEVLRRLSR
jgi:ParB family chromosome partitioning protein